MNNEIGFHLLQIIDVHIDEHEFNNNAHYKTMVCNILGYKRGIEVDLHDLINSQTDVIGIRVTEKASDANALKQIKQVVDLCINQQKAVPSTLTHEIPWDELPLIFKYSIFNETLALADLCCAINLLNSGNIDNSLNLYARAIQRFHGVSEHKHVTKYESDKRQELENKYHKGTKINQEKADNFWKPYIAKYDKYIKEGKTESWALNKIGEEIENSGTWTKASKPSKKTHQEKK